MGRRVIYIKNPSSGSNFRTVNGGNGGGSSRPPKAKKPPKGKKPPKDNGGWQIGDPIYSSPGKEWIKKNPRDILQTFFESPGNWFADAGPDSMEELLMWMPPETLMGDFYDIWIAQVAQRGNIQYAYGTPGTLKDVFAIDMANQLNAAGFRGFAANAFFAGDLPNSNLAHNRLEPRPWWAQ